MTSSPARTQMSSPRSLAPSSITHSPQQTRHRRRGESTSNDDDSDSDASRLTQFSIRKVPSRSPPSQSTVSLNQQARRPSNTSNASRTVNDLPLRSQSPTVDAPPHLGHRPRQHSQGFFEPSLPTASSNAPSMANLSASQIAAQAAMQNRDQGNQHARKRSTTIPEPGSQKVTGRRKPSPLPPVPNLNIPASASAPHPGGGHSGAATAAANVVFPRSPMHSPAITETATAIPMSPVMEKEGKPVKEKKSMKIWSKGPKAIGISREKDLDKRLPALPSPNRPGIYSNPSLPNKMLNMSTPSLLDSAAPSGASSIYSSANASTSTLVPLNREVTYGEKDKEKEKEKHRHHFLTRQRHKLKDKDDHHHLPLSSASSTSKPTDPNAPQPLYNFAAPNSPGHSSTFAQSMSGLDLRHGGRALRQKKKEEKAASSLETMLETPYQERGHSFSVERPDWGSAMSSQGVTPGPMTTGSLLAETSMPAVASLGIIFGIPNLTPEDAWPLIKARVLLIFEGQDPRPPIEDFNGLVSLHIKRCIQRQAPTVLIEDLTELLQTGFLSLDQTLKHVPDDRLVPKLVEMWTAVLTTILPFMQAVFLPLDLEFKGRGIMTAREAAGFWGASLPGANRDRSDSGGTRIKNVPILGEELDVRRITLLTFRDTVILPRHEALFAIFSRLSLENINAGIADPLPSPGQPQNSHLPPSQRPGTAHSLGEGMASWSSSNHLDSTSSSFSQTFTANSRSRATSNTSAGSFTSLPSTSTTQQQLQPTMLTHSRTHSNPPVPPIGGFVHAPPAPAPPPPMDSAKVTETVGKMLQCCAVLSSIRSGDEAQSKMEKLSAELKYNWLGRGRTGRNRRGFVGRKGTGLGVGGLGRVGVVG